MLHDSWLTLTPLQVLEHPNRTLQIRIIFKTVVLQSLLLTLWFLVTLNFACAPESVSDRPPAQLANYEADPSFRTSLRFACLYARLNYPRWHRKSLCDEGHVVTHQGAGYTSTEYVPAKNHCALGDPSIRKRSTIVYRMHREHDTPAFTTTKSQSVEEFCECSSPFLGSLDFSSLLASAFFTALLVHRKLYQVRSSDTGH
ncbi:hypothetical protein ARMSODRAFT_102948 [Armillaria solidipes]|uniref:Uncharacterized protein n=1 Tax=Armillaria solidipes TaxID=1076256 RepID=A0A2H3APP1_9AGAR|nr:hypothetical protein ARMSODRAFT_102948 [Armillaria solidipes]